MKRMIPILLMMTLLLTGCAVPKPATEANTYRQITMQEAVEMMEKEENYIILVNDGASSIQELTLLVNCMLEEEKDG